MRLKCFVACAFGHPDVDSVYKNIKNVLDSLDITAQQVDKINHNKKIDLKIIELIKGCDIILLSIRGTPKHPANRKSECIQRMNSIVRHF
jgi:hypothetical protein